MTIRRLAWGLAGLLALNAAATAAPPDKLPDAKPVSPYGGGTAAAPAPAAPAIVAPAPHLTTLEKITGEGCGPLGCGPIGCAPACAPLSCEPECEPCGPGGRVWAEAEYLLLWLQGASVPPLATLSPAGTPRNLAGVPGSPGLATIIGNDRLNDGVRSGFRVRGGFWLDECGTLGIDVGGLFIPGDEQSYTAGGDGNPIVSRPFINAATGPDAELVSFPNVLAGTVTVKSRNDLWGGEANLRYALCCDCDYRIDIFGGYRFLRFTEDLEITENLRALPGGAPTPDGTIINVFDRFRAENEFQGGQVGISGWYQIADRLSLTTRAAVALGNMRQRVDIFGATQVTVPGQATVTNTGGLLAQRSNIGSYTRDEFAVIPDVSLNLGYNLTDWLRLYAGYNFLYVSDVARPGQAIDPVINTTQIPPGTLNGVARPAFTGASSDLWIHGISFGAGVRF